jgi:microcystin degradation protein MlrC
MYETGERAGRLLLAMVRERQRHVVLWKRLPLMSHTLRSTTLSGAMRQAVESACAAEAGGVAAVSVFAGFALADIEAPCVSVVVTSVDTPSARAQAQAALDAIAEQIWAARSGFTYSSEPLGESLARAQAAAEHAGRPVLLLDHGDNCMSGGTCDTMDVLEAALAQGLNDIAVGPLCDPEAVRILARAGVGAEVELPLGNKIPLASIGVTKQPVVLRGTVRFVSDGQYTVTGPTYTGMRCSMGRSVHFDVGAAQIVVTERTQEPWDMGVFSCVGLDPTRHRFMLLKSRMYCRPVFAPLSAALIECDSIGVTSSDYALFPFRNVRRPVFPLDPL